MGALDATDSSVTGVRQNNNNRSGSGAEGGLEYDGGNAEDSLDGEESM